MHLLWSHVQSCMHAVNMQFIMHMCTMPHCQQAGRHMACMMFAISCFSPSFYSVLMSILKSLARTSYNMCDTILVRGFDSECTHTQ